MNLATVGLEWSIRGSGANLIVLSSQQDDRSSCVFVFLFVCLFYTNPELKMKNPGLNLCFMMLKSVLYDAPAKL